MVANGARLAIPRTAHAREAQENDEIKSFPREEFVITRTAGLGRFTRFLVFRR